MLEKFQQDMIKAMKEKNKEELSVLRMAKGAMDKIRIDQKKEVDDQLLIEVIAKEIKSRNDSIAEFKKGGREDLVSKTENEIDILKRYLPEQLSEEEVLKEIARISSGEVNEATLKYATELRYKLKLQFTA